MITLNLNDIISNHKCILFLWKRNVFYFFVKEMYFISFGKDLGS